MSSVGSYRIRIDLHVHTRRFSPCAEGLDPYRLPEIMQRGRLDGLVITEHDNLWPFEDVHRLNRQLQHGRIYNGVEVTSCNGHFVVIGLTRMDGITPGIDVMTLVEKAHAQKAVVIWAHPLLSYGNVPAPCTLLSPPMGIDAVEIPNGRPAAQSVADLQDLARIHGWTQVGGSDAHTLENVGTAATLFNALPKNEKHLAASIRERACRIGSFPDTEAHGRSA